MITAAINGALALLVVALACLGVAGYVSPRWLSWAAAHLMARKEQLEAGRTAYADGLRAWTHKCGVDE
jgi:hypothetical protein